MGLEWLVGAHVNTFFFFLLPSFPLPRGVNPVRAPFSSLDGFGISRPEQKKKTLTSISPPFLGGQKNECFKQGVASMMLFFYLTEIISYFLRPSLTTVSPLPLSFNNCRVRSSHILVRENCCGPRAGESTAMMVPLLVSAGKGKKLSASHIS